MIQALIDFYGSSRKHVYYLPLSCRYIDLVDATTRRYNGTESAAAAKLCSHNSATIGANMLDASPKCNDTLADDGKGLSSESTTELSDYQVRGSMKIVDF